MGGTPRAEVSSPLRARALKGAQVSPTPRELGVPGKAPLGAGPRQTKAPTEVLHAPQASARLARPAQTVSQSHLMIGCSALRCVREPSSSLIGQSPTCARLGLGAG